MTKRKDNWGLLEKFFTKMNIPIERAMMDGVMAAKDGAAVPLIEKMYQLLTNKQ
mgnify:CR=1 FL=1